MLIAVAESCQSHITYCDDLELILDALGLFMSLFFHVAVLHE